MNEIIFLVTASATALFIIFAAKFLFNLWIDIDYKITEFRIKRAIRKYKDEN